MNTVKYYREITALLVVDPYNDFISEGGKVWERLRDVAEANNCIPHMTARPQCGAERAVARVLCAPSTLPSPATTSRGSTSRPFKRPRGRERLSGTARGAARLAANSFHRRGDVVALEHWCSSGFANTDLDLQLKKHSIHRLIVIGLIAHTCVEAKHYGLPRNSATTSRWSRMRRRTIRRMPCTPRSTSTC